MERGRQALVEAERFPADFDGIVAGAPVALKAAIVEAYWTAMANLDANRHALLTYGAALRKRPTVVGL